MTGTVATAVSVLFVPGDRPDRFGKAVAAGADAVIIDWEDAVAPESKPLARTATVEALTAGDDRPALRVLVRVNPSGSPAAVEDLRALAAVWTRPDHGLLGVVVPKAADVGPLQDLVAQLSGSVTPLAVVALLESAAGVARAAELAAVPGVTRLAFGALDFALDVGSEPDAVTGQVARAQVVIASRAAGLPGPLESPAVEIHDTDAVESSSRAARVLGFTGRLCIHPAQLDPVRRGFAPTPELVAWARSVVEAGDAAVQVDGRMVDRPVRDRARAILAALRDPGDDSGASPRS